ncbi:hypothetical protein K8R43_03080, partial [archaeon]|nr:hypothetical protein [archaeon]
MKEVLAAVIIVLVAIILGISALFVLNLLGGNNGQKDGFMEVAVYDASSLRSLGGTEITIYDLDHNPIKEMIADDLGVVYVELPAGDYFLAAKTEDYKEEWFNVTIGGTAGKIVDIAL